MKGFILFLLCLIFTLSAVDTFAKSKKNRKGSNNGSNIYVSKYYKGHTCPKPRKVINAVYF